MCYVLKFKIDDSYKACKFTAFPRIFQIINYLFFKEVYNHNVYRVLRIKKPIEIMNPENYFRGSYILSLQFGRLCLWLPSSVPKSGDSDGVTLYVIDYFVQMVQDDTSVWF